MSSNEEEEEMRLKPRYPLGRKGMCTSSMHELVSIALEKIHGGHPLILQE